MMDASAAHLDERFSSERRGPAPAELRSIQDFVNTRDVLRGVDALQGPGDLHAFFVERGLLASSDGVSADDLREALQVREAIRGFLSRERLHLTEAETHLLDDVGRRARIGWTFGRDGSIGLEARRPGVAGALASVLAPLLSAAVTGSLARLKTCRNCGWVFYDHSKNRSGAWCSMELCGSRVKAKRHYWKDRSEPPVKAAPASGGGNGTARRAPVLV
jgi:predicted RNA-binding Zn ribbon-like protein